MSITVLDPGPLTTVQDAGRVGYAAQGYRSCGAADGYAYRLGNVLVGNDPGAAVLECTLRGAALRFETDTVFALTGLSLQYSISSFKYASWLFWIGVYFSTSKNFILFPDHVFSCFDIDSCLKCHRCLVTFIRFDKYDDWI